MILLVDIFSRRKKHGKDFKLAKFGSDKFDGVWTLWQSTLEYRRNRLPISPNQPVLTTYTEVKINCPVPVGMKI